MGLEREIGRGVLFRTEGGKTVRGTLHKLSRRNIVFEIYDPYLVLRTSEVLTELQLRRGRDAVYTGDAVVTDVVSTSILLIVSANLTGTWTGLDETFSHPGTVGSKAESFVNDWDEANKLNPDYRLRVSDLRSFLNDLRHWSDQLDLTLDVDRKTDGANAALAVDDIDAIKWAVVPRLTELSFGLEEACRNLEPKQIDVHKEMAQRELLPVVMPSPFFNRVFTKPLGYAGDYEMVNMMFKNEGAGNTTYARVIDGWLLLGGPCEAHRNRIIALEKILTELAEQTRPTNKPIRILNIGCGPVQELQLLFSKTKFANRFEIDLLDFNKDTLAYAESKLTPLLSGLDEKPEIHYNLKSVQDLLRQAIERAEPAEPYHFIYCAGLFDYLSDRVCDKLVRLFYHWCEPGGRVLITNVHSSNPVKGLMEHVMEWHLVLRDEPGMMRFAPANSDAKVYGDKTGINVFLELSKPS